MLPAIAVDESDNLITNGDASMGTWGDRGYTDALKGTDEWGFVVSGNTYAWRSAGHNTSFVPYYNASLYWQNTGSFAAAHPGRTDAPSIRVNRWNQTMQDIKIKAGKSYTVSLDAAFIPYETTSNYSGWFDVVIINKAGLFIDGTTNLWSDVKNVDYDLCDSGDAVYSTIYKDTSSGNVPTFTYGGATYWDFGDLNTYSFTFSSDNVIRDYELTDDDGDGYFDVTLGIQNNAGMVLAFDNVSVVDANPAVGTVTAEAGGTVNTDKVYSGMDNTLIATPYYGNTFKGWYVGDTLLSVDSTYVGPVNGDVTAKFNIYNQVVDGDFESDSDAALGYVTERTDADKTDRISVVDNPTGGTDRHGNKVLKVAHTAANNTNRYIVTLPFTAKKNTRYALHYSYYSADVDATSEITLHAADSFTINYINSTTIPSYTYHWEPEIGNNALGAWSVNGGMNGDYKILAKGTHATANAGMNKWIDVWFTFDSGDVATTFADGADTAEMFFYLGVGNSMTNSFYLDNISITEVGTAQNTAINAIADGDGTVAPADTALKPVCYVNNNGVTIGSVSTPIEGSTGYSQVAVTTYTATPGEGSRFDGWFNGNGELVSTKATETFYTEDTYTAIFTYVPYAKEGGYITENENGTYTAHSYYGNYFKGWFDREGKLITTSATTANHTGMYADFYKNNLIDGGDFEITALPEMFVSNRNRFTIAEFDSSIKNHGNKYVLYKAPSQETTNSAIKLPVKRNTDYTVAFDLKVTDFGANSGLRFGLLYDYTVWGATATIGGGTQTYLNPKTGYTRVYSSAAGQAHRPGMSLEYSEYVDKFQNDWMRFTITFNSGSDTNVFGSGDSGYLYLTVHGLNGGLEMQLDNLIFASAAAVSATAEGGGSAYADKQTAVLGKDVTFTATPDYGNRFIGWFTPSGETVSFSPVFTTAEHLNLVAKFKSFNGVAGGGFENGSIGDWATLGNSNVTFEVANHVSGIDSELGSKYLKVTDNATGYLNFGLPIKAEPNTRYLVHFTYKVSSTTNSRIDFMISPKNSWGSFADSTTYFSSATASEIKAGMYDNKYPNTIQSKFGDGFIEVNTILNTADELADGKTMYLLMGAKADGIFCIDNVSVTPISDIAPSMQGATLIGETGYYKESSISYQSTFGFVPTNAILKQVGTLAMPTQLFTGELTLDTPKVSYAAINDVSKINLNSGRYFATFTNTDTINPSAKISARSFATLTDKYGKHTWTFYSENDDKDKAIAGGVYNRSVNQVKRLLAVSLIEQLEGNYPADFWSDEDVNETTNVKSSASVSVDKVWNFVKRNAHLISNASVYVPVAQNLINDGGFENDEFYLGAQVVHKVTDSSNSLSGYVEGNGITYAYDHNGFIYYSASGGYFYDDGTTFSNYIKLDDTVSHTGERSLMLNTRAGTASYILRNLKPNTDYEFSYYWYSTTPVLVSNCYIYPHKYMDMGYDYVGNTTIGGTTYREYEYHTAPYLSANHSNIITYALDYTLGPVYADGSWKKETLKFNSGAATSVVFGINFGSRQNSGTLWLDDLYLSESALPENSFDGSFQNGTAGWEGSAATYKIDGYHSATFNTRGQYLKKNFTVEPYTDYTLTVKAKTAEPDALYFGVTDVNAKTLNPTTALTANSAVITDKSGTATYTVGFSSNINSYLSLFLQSVCDSKVHILSVDIEETDALINADTVDFEDGMTTVNGGLGPVYELAKTNNLWYYINSSVARSGKYSLRMAATSTDTNAASDIVTTGGDTLKHPLYQRWSEFHVNPGDWYTISYYVKASSAGVSYDSSIRTLDTSNWDYMKAIDKKTVTLNSTGWTLVEHTFANSLLTTQDCYANLVFSANDGTTADIYFDDIKITRTNAVAEDSVSAPYTESVFNLLPDGSFENGNPVYGAGSFISAADAYDGSNYLRVNAGQKLIVPVTTRVDYNFKPFYYYTLSGAVRAGSGGAGYVGISHSVDGNVPVLDKNGNVKAIRANGTGWSFDAFKFMSPDVRPTYLVIECTAGYIDIDSLSFFTDEHAFTVKPIESNSYFYDYDDLSNAVLNGGTAASGAISLSVNNSSSGIKSDTFTGVSGTVYFPIIEDVMDRKMSEQQFHLELSRMQAAGIKRVRTMFKSQWAYTGNEQNPWDWDSSKMQEFYYWCKEIEKYDIDVIMVAGWSLSSFVYGSSSISEVDYLSPRKLDSSGNVLYTVSWGIFHPVIDLDLAADRYAVWITEGINAIRDHGVENLTHVLTFNEPSHRNGTLYEGAHAAQMLKLVDTLVDKMKATYTDSTKTRTVRDSVILVGPNQSNTSNHAGLAEYFAENSKYGYDLYDIWTTHALESLTNYNINGDAVQQNATTVGAAGDRYSTAYSRYSSWLSRLKSIDSRFSDVNFWCDEFHVGEYSFRYNGYNDTQLRWWGVKQAGQYAALMNSGLSGAILWEYTDTPWSYMSGSGGEFLYGIHQTGGSPSALESQTPYYIYYSVSMLTKYLSTGNGNAITYNSTSAHSNVHISSVKMADGNWSVLVVNNSETAQNISVNFQSSIGGKNMYRHVYEAATITPDASGTLIDADKTYSNVTTKLNDTIPAGSVVVYTSIKG